MNPMQFLFMKCMSLRALLFCFQNVKVVKLECSVVSAPSQDRSVIHVLKYDVDIGVCVFYILIHVCV